MIRSKKQRDNKLSKSGYRSFTRSGSGISYSVYYSNNYYNSFSSNWNLSSSTLNSRCWSITGIYNRFASLSGIYN